MARFGLQLITEHLPRIGRRNPPASISSIPAPADNSRPNYWMEDCALHPWRKGCRTYDV